MPADQRASLAPTETEPPRLLTEAALFGVDTFFDEAAHPIASDLPYLNAPMRGWQPLSLGALAPEGVQLVDLSPFVPPELGGPATEMDSAAHFYTGELEGRRTLAAAFRSTDDGPAEFAFQGLDLRAVPDPFGAEWGWDIYHALHAPAVRAALAHAADPANGIEQVLITGHSLGGILAELATARILLGEFPELAGRAIAVTFGSPGSTADASGAQLFNLVNSDDLVARLSDFSPLFRANGAAREGVDLAVDRPEGELPPLAPEDLDTPEEVLAALAVPAHRAEHGIALYVDDATALKEAERAVPGVAGRSGDPFRWLAVEVERAVVGTAGPDRLAGGEDAEALLGRDGTDILRAGGGADGLSGGGSGDWLFGGEDDDLVDGGAGDDHAFGWTGADRFLIGPGHDRILGGPGRDTALLPEGIGNLEVDLGRHKTTVRGELAGETVHAELFGVERLAFADPDGAGADFLL